MLPGGLSPADRWWWMHKRETAEWPVSRVLVYAGHSHTIQISVHRLKDAQPKSWELCFIWWTFWALKPGRQLLKIVLRGRSKEVREEPLQDIQEFCSKNQVVRTSKDDCQLKKTKHLKLTNLTLFYVWEDARVWAYWNHSFAMHLSCPGPVSCPFPSCVPSGCALRVAAVAEGLAVAARLSLLSSLRAHRQGRL